MRIITDHVVEGDDAPQLTVWAVDEPSHGGACHEYMITWLGGVTLDADGRNTVGTREVRIGFQTGPIKEHGINGITESALLAIVIDRLRSFQAGPFASPLNYSALRNCEEALENLQQRTRDRIKRGVEGLSKACR